MLAVSCGRAFASSLVSSRSDCPDGQDLHPPWLTNSSAAWFLVTDCSFIFLFPSPPKKKTRWSLSPHSSPATCSWFFTPNRTGPSVEVRSRLHLRPSQRRQKECDSAPQIDGSAPDRPTTLWSDCCSLRYCWPTTATRPSARRELNFNCFLHFARRSLPVGKDHLRRQKYLLRVGHLHRTWPSHPPQAMNTPLATSSLSRDVSFEVDGVSGLALSSPCFTTSSPCSSWSSRSFSCVRLSCSF